MNIQIIEHNGAPEYAIIPFDEWEKIISRMEEMEDIRDARNISAAIAAGGRCSHAGATAGWALDGCLACRLVSVARQAYVGRAGVRGGARGPRPGSGGAARRGRQGV